MKVADTALPLVSVIIPTFNEELLLDRCLQAVSQQGAGVEIIVVDGQSCDRTCAIAARYARVINANRGRGIQMNEGARQARGEYLLFLHADCVLPAAAIEQIRKILADAKVKAGCFRQRIQAGALVYRFVELAALCRIKWLQTIYGDCGLFLRRQLFSAFHGFPEVKLFEDVGISQRLKKIPGRIVVSSLRIQISARRWKKLGFWRTTMLNWRLALSYKFGAQPEKLYRKYLLK